MSSTNHLEPSWKAYYDAKKILRQTEQRLNETRGTYYPHVHSNNHYETIDHSNLSTASSSFVVHADQSSMSKHQLLDSEALQTIRRKINKQKLAAGRQTPHASRCHAHALLERRADQLFHSQSDAGHMFESSRAHCTYSTSASLQNLHYSPLRQQRTTLPPAPPPPPPPSQSFHLPQSQSFPSELDAVLRHSTSSRILHRENEIVRTNDLERSSFHQSITRNTSKILPSKYSLARDSNASAPFLHRQKIPTRCPTVASHNSAVQVPRRV